MTARHLVINGIVQGVGYRDWLVVNARKLGLTGWVRNRADGTVEALVSGETGAVEECLNACRLGPKLAVVEGISETLIESPEDVEKDAGFIKRPDA